MTDYITYKLDDVTVSLFINDDDDDVDVDVFVVVERRVTAQLGEMVSS